jgi:hypothetical protein
LGLEKNFLWNGIVEQVDRISTKQDNPLIGNKSGLPRKRMHFRKQARTGELVEQRGKSVRTIQFIKGTAHV